MKRFFLSLSLSVVLEMNFFLVNMPFQCQNYEAELTVLNLQSTRRELLQKRLNYILRLKKIENAFFLLLLQAVVVIFQNYREERVYSKSFHFVTHATLRARSRAKGCVRKIFGSAM